MFQIFRQARLRRQVHWLVYNEIRTRFYWLIKKPDAPINFIEFLNDIFPFVNALREHLALIGPDTASIQEFSSMYRLIDNLNDFVDHWHASYTGWLADHKSKSPGAKAIIRRGSEQVYEELQSFYPKSVEFSGDARYLLNQMDEIQNYCQIQGGFNG
jgi:hypothetical protein